MVERMKQGMANAYRKDREDRRDVPADNVVVDLTENGLSVHVVKTCVDVLEAYDNGKLTVTAGKETITFEKSEVALVRLRVEF